MARNTKIDTERVVRQVINDLLDGAVKSVIQQKFRDGSYGKKFHSFSDEERVYRIARNRIIEDFKAENEYHRELCVNRLLDLYTDSKKVGDRATALNAIKELNKMRGAYLPENINLNMNGAIEIDFNYNED